MTSENLYPMHLVFCVDKKALPGLHVAAYSLLESLSSAAPLAVFHIFGDQLLSADLAALDKTLSKTRKNFRLEYHLIEAKAFSQFPALNHSLAPYYRLLAAQVLDVPRFLYVDADTLCDLDVYTLNTINLGEAPAALVPEATLGTCVDTDLAKQLSSDRDTPYFNSGVLLVQVDQWRQQAITEQCLKYLSTNKAKYHDQTALNYVLHRIASVLPRQFNLRTNARENWPILKAPLGNINSLIHFIDYPKPWDPLGKWIHPQAHIWWSTFSRIGMDDDDFFRRHNPERFKFSSMNLKKYQKSVKDCILFRGYRAGWFRNVKGLPETSKLNAG